MSVKRIQKINDQLMREVSAIIRELKDARVPLMTSVMAAEATNDLRYAKIYVSVMGDEQTQKDALAGLSSAAGFIRRELGGRMDLHYTPELIFVIDHSIAHGAHINRILRDIIKDGDE